MMTTRKHTHFIIILAIFVCAIALRGIHIDADTPSGLSWSAGLYVDEGYKTLSPRNLILFGDTHWHTADTYPGWMGHSPITQWSVYAAFKNFGVNISSARLVPIIYFSLFILLYIFFMYRRLNLKLFYLGLILLVTDITLFTFSRVALFEIPISFFLYAMILPLSLLNENEEASLTSVVWLFISGAVIAYAVKLSALIYTFPVLGAASLFYLTKNNAITKKHITIFASILSAAIFVILSFSYDLWSARLNISPQLYIYNVIENPLLLTSPFILIIGTLCAAHAIGCQSSLYFKNLYRLSLLSMVVSAPLILSLFTYNPLRYYVPFVPAYILLILEWFSTTPSDTMRRTASYAFYATSALLLGLTIMYALTALNLNEHLQMRFLIIFAAGIVVILWRFRHLFCSNKMIKSIISSLIALSILHSVYFINTFISSPSYHANAMRARLSGIVKKDESVSGGWAPFLTLGTPIKAIYANTDFNPPSSLKKIKPNYFILSNTPTALKTFKILNDDKNILVGNSIDLGVYNETTVQMYPLSYTE